MVRELVVFGGNDDLRSRIARRDRSTSEHRHGGCDRQPPLDERVRDVERDHGSERVAGQDHRSVGFEKVGQFARSREIEPLSVAAVVLTPGGAPATEVRCDRVAPERRCGFLQRRHDMVVAVATVERVRMADHHGCTRAWHVGAHDVGLDRDAVECLERNSFGPHANDGTVPLVTSQDQRLPIKMLNDRLLVRIPHGEGERRSSGGIVIPATAQISKRLVWAEVVALGVNVRSAETGDQVLFSPDDRYEVEVGGIDYIMLRERDLHAVAAPRNEASTGLYL